MNIGLKIKTQRKKKKMTQEQLGEAIGVSKMTISKYERNIIDNMGREKIKALSTLLDIPIVDFLESTNDTENSKRVTRKDFTLEVLHLLDKTEGLSEQEKQFIKNSLSIISNKEE